MLFINVVKLFHSHPVTADPVAFAKAVSSHHSGDIAPHRINQNDHCAICDFKLAKDAETSDTYISSIPIFSEAPVTEAKLPACIPVSLSISFGRAPPALA